MKRVCERAECKRELSEGYTHAYSPSAPFIDASDVRRTRRSRCPAVFSEVNRTVFLRESQLLNPSPLRSRVFASSAPELRTDLVWRQIHALQCVGSMGSRPPFCVDPSIPGGVRSRVLLDSLKPCSVEPLEIPRS